MERVIIVFNKFKLAIQQIIRIFSSVNSSADLKLDAIIFSKQTSCQIRALITGTGLYITLPLDQLLEDNPFLIRFSHPDREIIKNIINDKTNLYSTLIDSRKIEIISKTVDKVTRKVSLKISIADCYHNNVELELDASELSRNKYLLQLFNKIDNFNIGYSAAESRIRTEQLEIKKANQFIQEQNNA